MNLPSYIVLGLVFIWLAAAVLRILRNGGNTCGCAGECGKHAAKSDCDGCCAMCAHRKGGGQCCPNGMDYDHGTRN